MSLSLSRFSRALAAAVLFVALAATAKAQLFWDPTVTGTSTGGGPGNWNTTDPFWYNGASNGVWTNASNASFGGAAGGTVVIQSAGMTFTNMSFTTGGYVLDNTNSLGFASATTNTIDVAAGLTATINTNLSGTITNVIKTGSGILVLGGTNTFVTGVASAGSLVTINAGTLSVSADANLGAAPTANTNAVNLNGATLQLTGGTWTWTTARRINVTGAGTIDLGAGATVTSAALTRGTGSITVTGDPTANLLLSGASDYTGGFTLASGRVTMNGASNSTTSGPLGRAAISFTGGILATDSTAARSISNPITISGSPTFAPGFNSNGLTFTGTVNITGNPTITTNGASLTLIGGAASVVTLSSDATFAGTSGFAFVTGIASLGATPGNRTLTLTQTSTAAVLRGALVFGTNTLTLAGTSTVLLGSTSGPVTGTTGGIIINGATGNFGALLSGASSTFTGGVRLQAGSISIANTSSFGTPMTSSPVGLGTLRLSGGTIRGLTTAWSLGNDLLIDGDVTFGTGGVGLSFTSTATGAAQVISGDRTLTFGAGTTSFVPTAGNVSTTGNLTAVGAGAFVLGNLSLGGNLLITNTGTATLGNLTGSVNYNSLPRTITKATTGTVTINGIAATNSVPGNAINVTAGTINVVDPSYLGNAGDTSINVQAVTANSAFGLTGTGTSFTAGGNLNLGGAGSFTSTLAIGANTFTVGGNINYDGTAATGQGVITSTGATGTQGLNLGNIQRTFNVGDSSGQATDLNVTAVINGTGGFIKDGLGAMVVSGVNTTTLSGPIVVSAGRLTAGTTASLVDGTLGDAVSGTTVANNATLSISSPAGGTFTVAENITLNGAGSSGRLGAFDLNTTTGTITVPHAITLGSAASIGNSAGAVFALTGNINTAGFALTINNSNTISVAGNITGGGTVLKINTGNFILSGTASSVTGFEIQRGTITLGASGANVMGSDLLLNSQSGTATLALNTFTTTLNNITVSGLAATTGAITTGVGGGFTLLGNVVLDATNNPTQVTLAGAVDLGSTSHTITVGDSTATANTSSDLVLSGNLTGTATAAIVKLGPGALNISGSGSVTTYLGAITLSAGRLIVSVDGSLGSTAAPLTVGNNTTLTFNAITYTSPKPVTIIGTGDTGRAGAIDLNTNSSAFPGPITMLGASTIGNNSATTGTRLTLSGNIDNGGFKLTAVGSQSLTFSGVISGSGALEKPTGAGNLTLGGGAADTNPNTYTGGTTFGAGSLTLSKADNVVAVPGDFVMTGGTLNAMPQANQFPATSNWTVSGGTYNGSTTAQTIASITQSGGTLQSGASAFTVTGAVIVTSTGTTNFTINSAATVSVGSVSYQGVGTYIVGGNLATRTSYTIGSGGLSLNGATFTTASNGTASTAGTTVILNGDVNSTGTSVITRANAATNDPSGLTGAVDFNTGTRTFTVAGTLTVSSPIHNGSLVKEGTGNLVLNAAAVTATPIVNVSVNNGTLIVGDVALSTASIGAGATPVLVASGATIGGHGTINRGTLLAGTLSPGTSVGQLTTTAGTATWSPGGSYKFEYDATATSPAPTTTSDHFLGTGTAVLDLSTLSTSNKFTFNLVAVGTAGATPVDYTVATFPLGGITAPTGIVGADLTPYFDFTGDYTGTPTATLVSGDSIVLNFTPSNTPVPEPAIALAVAALGLFAVRRRK